MDAFSKGKRSLLKGVAAASLLGRAGHANETSQFDVVVVGAGNAGLPTAIFAAQRGLTVAIIETSGVVGGTLHLSTGQMSAAGTKLQKSKGIDDTPKMHFDDVMRISKGTADPALVKLATDNAAAAFDWLTDSGFTVYPEHPITGTTHDPYSRPRYAWAKEGGRAILDILEAHLNPLVESGKVKVMLSTEAKELITDATGAVVGVLAQGDDSQSLQVMGKSVVLTSGGYLFNPAMYRELEKAPLHTNVTWPYNMGAGLTMAVAVGGYIRGGQNHTPLFGAILADADRPTQIRALARHYPGNRPPWEIIVDAFGKRFLREDTLSHDSYEQAIIEQPDEKCWIVFDSEILENAPRLAAGSVFSPWGQQDTIEAFKTGEVPYFYSADTIEALGAKANIDAKGLAETIAAYNKAQSGAAEDFLGRKHMPRPIAKAPFHAIETFSWNLSGSAGIAVDDQLRVIRQDGRPIGGLYAAGELLGMGQLMGKSVAGGMSVTPALALGRLLGEKILPG